jgi:GLPGLI family protein
MNGMKPSLIFLLFLLPFCTRAQEQPLEGKIRYLVTHNWVKKLAAVDYLSKQRRERAAYMWGNDSEWKMYSTLYFSPTESRYEDSEEKAEPDDEGYSWRKDVYQIKRNFASNTIYEAVVLLGKTYVIEDTLRPQPWKILNDLKEVAGHLCMNAIWQDTLKDQKIVAWFALDIPVPAGPERFHGLPGLILEIDVNDGGMIVSADKLDLRALAPKELELPKKVKGKKIDEAAYFGIVRKHYEEKRKNEEPPFWGIRY